MPTCTLQYKNVGFDKTKFKPFKEAGAQVRKSVRFNLFHKFLQHSPSVQTRVRQSVG